MEEMYVVPCESIYNTVVVVQNRTIPVSTNKFFVVKNRSYLLESFNKSIDKVSRKSLNVLYDEGEEFYNQCIETN